MLHVTNETMKKNILIISASILFVFAATGCETQGDDNTIPCPDNASCQVMPDKSIIISYNQPIALSEAINALPPGYGISRMTAIESEHYFTVAYPSPNLDIHQIILNYQDARDENLEELINIQDDTLDRRSSEDSEYINSLREGVDKLNAIKKTCYLGTSPISL